MNPNLLKPKDVIAVVIIICFVFLMFNGIQGPLDQVIPLVLGYYFGSRKSGIDSGH
jgi:hypothetical protein